MAGREGYRQSLWGSASETTRSVIRKKFPQSNGYQMAGKPGRSGGSRPGAGRPKNEPVLSASTALLTKDPKDFLTAVMNDPETDMKVRTDAAKALMPYVHGRIGEQGKKQAKDEAAKKATGRFSPPTPPTLRVVGGK